MFKKTCKMSIWIIWWFQSDLPNYYQLVIDFYHLANLAKLCRFIWPIGIILLNDFKGVIFHITIGISWFFTKRLNEFSFNNQYQSICDWFYRFLPLVKKCDESYDQSAKIMPKVLTVESFDFNQWKIKKRKWEIREW